MPHAPVNQILDIGVVAYARDTALWSLQARTTALFAHRGGDAAATRDVTARPAFGMRAAPRDDLPARLVNQRSAPLRSTSRGTSARRYCSAMASADVRTGP